MKIYALNARNFKPYGVIINASCVNDDGKKNAFGILLKERARGWRIGYLVMRDRVMTRIESHPDSLETFEPVRGKVLMAFSPDVYPDRLRFFMLDKPVVVKKGVWHGLAAVSGRAEIKIFENIEVTTEYYDLKIPVKAPERSPQRAPKRGGKER